MQETMMEKGQDKMSLEGFVKCVQMDAQKKFGDDYVIHVSEIIKNNNLVLQGLQIMKRGCNISPTIYLDYYYQMYLDGVQLEAVEAEIQKVYEKSKLEADFDTTVFTDWNQAKGNIMFKIINAERNKELLNKVPNFKVLDLAVVFYYMFNSSDSDENGAATILIYNHQLDFWKKSKEELYDLALENTEQRLPYELRNMNELIKEMMGTIVEEDGLTEEMLEAEVPMYVLTNNKKLNGAACILYKDLLKDISEKLESDLYIIPSSIHECLLIPAKKGNRDYEELTSMVKEVNETQLAPEEILADHVYFFDSSTGELEIEVAEVVEK